MIRESDYQFDDKPCNHALFSINLAGFYEVFFVVLACGSLEVFSGYSQAERSGKPYAESHILLAIKPRCV